MIRSVRLVIKCDFSIISMPNLDNYALKILSFLFFHTTTELLLIYGTGEVERFTLEMFCF